MENKPKNKKKRLVIILVIVALAVLVILRIVDANKPVTIAEKVPVNVSISKAFIGSVYATSPLTGRIDPIASATIFPMAAGEVTAVHVSLGDYVEKDTVLFELDKGQVSSSYQQAKIAYASAKNDFDRLAVLYKEGAVSLQQYQGAETQRNIAQQNLNSAADALGYYTVRSPINGYVTSVNIAVGGIASQASPAVTIADISELEINTSISEYLVSKVHVGDPVDVFIKTLSPMPFLGRIKELSPAPAGSTLTYPLTIALEDETEMVKAGMFAEIQVVSDRKDDVLCVPSEAVFIKSGESRIVILKDQIPSIVTVVTGLDNGILVEIVSGLSEGDTVVTSGQQYVVDGEEVTIAGK